MSRETVIKAFCDRCGASVGMDRYVDVEVHFTEVGRDEKPFSGEWCRRCASMLRELIGPATAGGPVIGRQTRYRRANA